MILVTRVTGRLEAHPPGERRIEWVTLDFEAMSRSHQRVTTDAGTDVAISLERGTRLAAGDVLHVDTARIVAVRAAEDDALVVTPRDPIEWGLVGFHLGNRHAVVFFQPSAILTPYDHTLEALLGGLDVPCRRERRPLTGMRASAHAH